MKTCTRCKEGKPRDRFTRFARNKDGLSPWCKQCTQAVNRAYRERNRERLLAAKRADYRKDPSRQRAGHERWKAANPNRHRYLVRRSHLKRMYGITPEQYDALLDIQGQACAICKKPAGSDRLHVDHDHACCPGKRSCGECIRGLLCGGCNRLLGWFEARRSLIDEYVTRRVPRSWPS